MVTANGPRKSANKHRTTVTRTLKLSHRSEIISIKSRSTLEMKEKKIVISVCVRERER